MISHFHRTIESFDSPESICSYMHTHLHYASSEQREHSKRHGHHWKKPCETFKDGYGYCYDLAAFALASLEMSGFKSAQLLFVYWGRWGIEGNTGHFVCVYPSQQDYGIIDNGILKTASSFDQLLQQASRNRDISGYRWFDSHQIPYHTRYADMAHFCSDSENSAQPFKSGYTT